MECLENGSFYDYDPIDPDVELDISSPPLKKHYKKMSYLEALLYNPYSYDRRMNKGRPSPIILEETNIPQYLGQF